jgi:glyoxylase-like metal-dependent hydrolase (beta-lactamase superfamily II)
MKAIRVAPGVLRLPEPGVNAYYLEAERVLVDTGLPFLAEELAAALQELPLDLVVLTHADVAHAGGLAVLRGHRPVPVAAASPEIPYLQREAQRRGRRALLSFLQPPLGVDRTLAGGDRLGAFVVVATPGHSPGHLSLFRAEDGVLVAGDACSVRNLRVRRPNVNDDDRLVRRSLFALALLPVTTLLPGHGPPLAVGPADLIAAAL